MTTAAKRARKKANRKAKLERLAELMESIDALSGEDLAEVNLPPRPESEKAAAAMALAAAKRFGKKLKNE